MKYPIGIQDFEKIITGGYVYVDKTALVYRLVTEGNIYFLSRPRRFGKSLLVSTLEAYFQGRKDLFKGLAIDELEKEWAKYPVFHLSFGGENFLKHGALDTKLENIIGAWEAEYGTDPNYTTLGNRFQYVLKAAHQKFGRRAVVLIDEYDKPLLDVLDSGMKTSDGRNELLLEEHNRNVLKGFYSVFKSANADLQFVLLTGVSQCWDHILCDYSANNLTLDSRYNSLCGYSAEELLNNFTEVITELSSKYGYTFNETTEHLHQKYGGYYFSESTTEIYNPYSIMNVFSQLWLNDFWIGAFDPNYLIKRLIWNQEQIDNFVGKYYNSFEFCNFSTIIPHTLPLLYQYGCLTIRGYDMKYDFWKLDIPNKEVENGLKTLLEWYTPVFSSETGTINEFKVI